jgi:hypothetical protein
VLARGISRIGKEAKAAKEKPTAFRKAVRGNQQGEE